MTETMYAPGVRLAHIWCTELPDPEDLLICDDAKRVVASYWRGVSDGKAVVLSAPSMAIEDGLLVSRCEVLAVK